VSVFLVRHAKAGSRSSWDGDDRQRPLSKNGRKQAESIASRLAPRGAASLYSSPFVRCRQTLEPLAATLALDIVDDLRLSEAARFEESLELLASVAEGAVLCSHGDVIPETIAALERRGCDVGRPDWRKGSVWTIERADDLSFVRARVWVPDD
jgi:8-oxo-dGTP diphosphatase